MAALHEAFTTGELRFSGILAALSDPQGFADHLQLARAQEWVVYAKPPFGGPAQVLDYVGRYTHRVAIANHRLVEVAAGQVRFRYKDYRTGQPHKTMTLTAQEFIRRVLLHVLPPGFHRMRYYGFLGNRHRTETLARCRQLLGMGAMSTPADETTPASDYRDQYETLTGVSLRTCPRCHDGHMLIIDSFARVPALLDSS